MPSYLITNQDKTKYLSLTSSNSITTTTTKRTASVWDTLKKANNVIKGLPRSLIINDTWSPITIDGTNILLSTMQPYEPPTQTPTTIPQVPEPSDYIFPQSPTPLYTETQNFINTCKDLQSRVPELQSQLNKCNREIIDIYHYIEFSNLNAYQGYKVTALLKEILTERRKLKNELEQITLISNNVNLDNLSSLLQTKHYTPRELTTLFSEGI